jgi:hypothetical protein
MPLEAPVMRIVLPSRLGMATPRAECVEVETVFQGDALASKHFAVLDDSV